MCVPLCWPDDSCAEGLPRPPACSVRPHLEASSQSLLDCTCCARSSNNTSGLCWRLEWSREGLRWTRLLATLTSFLLRAGGSGRISVCAALRGLLFGRSGCGRRFAVVLRLGQMKVIELVGESSLSCSLGGSNHYLPAWNGGGQLALERGRVYGKAGRTTLETRVTADAEPVSNAGLLDEHQTVWCVLANRVLLAVWNIVWPITGVYGVVVEE